MDVSVHHEADGRFLVKLTADEWEVTVTLSATDIRALVTSTTHWSEHGVLRAGESEGAPVFWASDGEQAKLLIGHDDETRDDDIPVPFRVLDEIRRTLLSAREPSFRGDATLTQTYEPPSPDDDLVEKLRAAVASVPDLHEAYLVARRTAWSEQEKLELGVIGQIGGSSHPGPAVRPLERQAPSSLEAVRVALAPFSPPNETAPLAWCAYATTPVPDEARDAGIRLA